MQMLSLHTSFWVQLLPSSHGAVLVTKSQPVAVRQVSSVHGLPSEQASACPGTHAPPAQTSPTVHTLPSEQVAEVSEWAQPPVGSQESAVQPLPSSHKEAAPGTQMLPAQASPTVHVLLSVQAAVLAAYRQPPKASHESVVHGLPSLQLSSAPAKQAPSAQTSPTVQALPSLHTLLLLMCRQPVSGSHWSTVHGLASSQPLAKPPVQTPATQASPTVHALPSEHTSVVFVYTQPTVALQPSAVHGLPSLHTAAAPPMHAPCWQVSPTLHALPSVQALSRSWNTHPCWGSQKSTVHALSSAQPVTSPGMHTEPTHTSPAVQALASLQTLAPGTITQPKVESHTWLVHSLALAQSTATPAWHAPPEHRSPLVQEFRSSHACALLADWQPVCGWQKLVVQGLPSSHAVTTPGRQTPPPQVSPSVHALPSVHVAVLGK